MAKYIYEFELPKEVVVDKTEESVNENGETVSITRKVKESVSIKFGFKKPTKSQKDDLDLEYKVYFSKAVQKGVLPIAILQKNINNSDGILSTQDIERIKEISVRYQELITEREKSESDKEVIDQELKDLMREFDIVNQREARIYNNSAEGFAKSKITSFLLVQNSWNITDNKAFFEGKTNEEALEFMEDIDSSEDVFQRNALKIFLLIASAYLNNDKLPQGSLDEAIVRVLTNDI